MPNGQPAANFMMMFDPELEHVSFIFDTIELGSLIVCGLLAVPDDFVPKQTSAARASLSCQSVHGCSRSQKFTACYLPKMALPSASRLEVALRSPRLLRSVRASTAFDSPSKQTPTGEPQRLNGVREDCAVLWSTRHAVLMRTTLTRKSLSEFTGRHKGIALRIP